MARKALHLVVDLEIQAVTCPGVWLCPNGNVQLLFSMLGEEVQTKRLPPVFPLLFHEKHVFEKTFPSAGCLAEVQDTLGRENVYAVLIQEVEGPNGSAAVQLARFHSSALHILYPSPCSKGLLAGVDVDLLMEASADFPGILSPKIELSTKTIVKEVASAVQDGYIINPKTLSSQRISLRHCAEGDVKTTDPRGKFRISSTRQPEQGQKFKHGQGSSNSWAIPRVPPSRMQHRSSHSNVNAHPNRHLHCTEKCGLQESTQDCNEFCHCGTEHSASKCPLCMQYKNVFSSFSDFKDTQQDQYRNHPAGCMKKWPISAKIENTNRLSKSLHDHVDRILEPTMSNILHNRDFNAYAPFSQSQSHHGISQRKQESNITESVKKPCESDPCFQVSCGSGDEYISHRKLFYANLEKFYRKLYDRAKSRAQEENCSGTNGN